MKNVFLALFLLFFVFLLLFFFLAHVEPWEKGADLRVALGPEPKTLDPGIATGSIEIQYIKSLLEGLVTFDSKNPLKPVPGMAESWTISPDQKTYTFSLRKAFWSNGDPVTTHDFYYSWRRILDIKIDCEYLNFFYYIKNAEAYSAAKLAVLAVEKLSKSSPEEKLKLIENDIIPGGTKSLSPLLEDLARRERYSLVQKNLYKALSMVRSRADMPFESVGIKVIDAKTLQVELANQTPYILEIFAFSTLCPVPARVVEKYGDQWTKPENMVCNGPYLVTRWKPHYMIILEKNPRYYDQKKVRLQRIASFIIDNPATALNYYECGYLDYLDKTAIPTDFVESLMKRKDFLANPTISTTFFRFNVTRPPFDDPRVRKAFCMAMDKSEIIETLRTGEKSTDVLVPPLGDYQNYQPKGLSYQPKEARKLLNEAYPDLNKFPVVEFLVSTGGAKNKDIFTVIRNQLQKNLGITIELKQQEWQVYLQSLSKMDYQLGFSAWVGDYADPNTFIDMWISSSGNNRTGWESKEYDQWVRDAAQTKDPDKRMKILARCEKRILEEDVIVLPLYFRTAYLMIKPYVRGVVPNVMERFPLQNFWVEK